ncbi:MAG: hypothetical protein QM493_06900 [Sulfurovum sp.]
MNKKVLYDADYDYVSWISNVSGRLFFRLTGGYNYRYDRIVGDVIHFNQEVENKRIIFISLLADLRDIDKDRTTHSKFTRIILSAWANPSDCHGEFLYGNIYFVDDSNHNSLQKSTKEQIFLKTIIEAIDNKRLNKEFIDTQLADFLEANQENEVIKNVEFKIQDTGVIHLKKVDNYPIETRDIDPDVKAGFYFIKFTFHKDRHHHHSEENIIRIIPTQKIAECQKYHSNCSKDYQIAYYIIEGVKQYVAEKRKLGNTSKMFDNLKGVLIYTQTMCESFIEYLIKNECKESIRQQQRYIDNLADSIERELDKKVYKPATFYEFVPELRNLLFFPLLLLSVFYATVRLRLVDYHISIEQVQNIFLGSIFLALLIMESFRKFYYKDDTFFIDSISSIPERLLRIIKKYSNPNLPKSNIFTRKIFPSIINIEMTLRRGSYREKLWSMVLFLLFYIDISIYTYIYLFIN